MMDNICHFEVDCRKCPIKRDCPAEYAVRICNTIQNRLSQCNYSQIMQLYEGTIEDTLQEAKLGRPAVFWSPGWEKSVLDAYLNKVANISPDEPTTLTNDILVRINAKVHSHPFLRSLIADRGGNVVVFNIVPKDEAVSLDVCCSAHSVSESYAVKELTFAGHSVKGCARTCRALAENKDEDGLYEAVREFTGSYSATPPSLLEECKTEFKTLDDPSVVAEAVRHFALISLFCEVNQCNGATFFLSSASYGDMRSSMIIYWKNRIPGKALLFLLQMLLNLNAAPILHHNSLIKARETAIQHYGHTMGHRVAPIISYLNKHDPEGYASRSAKLLGDLALLLQAYAIESREEFYKLNRDKRGRFLEHTPELDMLDLIRRDVLPFVERDEVVKDGASGSTWHRVAKLRDCPRSAKVSLCMTDNDKDNRLSCRLHRVFYVQLLTELFINAVRHGDTFRADEDEASKTAAVVIDIGVGMMGGRPVLVVSNYFSPNKKRPPSFLRSNWNRWPASGEMQNSGPGMAISIFRSLGVGDVFGRITEEDGVHSLEVAIQLEGLAVEDA